MTRWFEHEQAGDAFNDTIFAIFGKDSPLGRFADGEMISFDEETLYELADRDYGLDFWVLPPSHAANEMMGNAVHGNSSLQAGTAAIVAINGYMRERIRLLEKTVRLFAEAQKQPAANKTAAELSRWRKSLAKLNCRDPAPRRGFAQQPLIYKGDAGRLMVCRQLSFANESRSLARKGCIP